MQRLISYFEQAIAKEHGLIFVEGNDIAEITR
jgi:hypothetical protein